jgi:hypothetical protein
MRVYGMDLDHVGKWVTWLELSIPIGDQSSASVLFGAFHSTSNALAWIENLDADVFLDSYQE